MDGEGCIMLECPYCPACRYGLIVYNDEDYDGYEEPEFCEWRCLLDLFG